MEEKCQRLTLKFLGWNNQALCLATLGTLAPKELPAQPSTPPYTRRARGTFRYSPTGIKSDSIAYIKGVIGKKQLSKQICVTPLLQSLFVLISL